MENNICIEIDDSVDNNHLFGQDNLKVTMPEHDFDTDNFIAKQLDYQENTTMPELKRIAEYYDISVRKLRKDELIQELVIFEGDPVNAEVYLKRLQAWYWMKELKSDPKLKQYVLF